MRSRSVSRWRNLLGQCFTDIQAWLDPNRPAMPAGPARRPPDRVGDDPVAADQGPVAPSNSRLRDDLRHSAIDPGQRPSFRPGRQWSSP